MTRMMMMLGVVIFNLRSPYSFNLKALTLKAFFLFNRSKFCRLHTFVGTPLKRSMYVLNHQEPANLSSWNMDQSFHLYGWSPFVCFVEYEPISTFTVCRHVILRCRHSPEPDSNSIYRRCFMDCRAPISLLVQLFSVCTIVCFEEYLLQFVAIIL